MSETHKRAPRRPSLGNLLKQAKKAGQSVRRANVHADGEHLEIELTFGEMESPTRDPWQKAIEDLTKQ